MSVLAQQAKRIDETRPVGHVLISFNHIQATNAFDELTAMFEDDQIGEGLKTACARLLVGIGGLLKREKEIHPGIVAHAKPNPEEPTNPFQGPLYTFTGSTPADEPPDNGDWRLQAVRTDPAIGEGPSEELYRYRYNSDDKTVAVTDRRFAVYTGATRDFS